MKRRDILIGAGTLAGIIGAGYGAFSIANWRVRNTTGPTSLPSLVENRPDAVYYPTHIEGMKVYGIKENGPYMCGLTYTYPHRFWTTTGQRTEKVEIQEDDSIHLMPLVWDKKTGIIPADISPSITIAENNSESGSNGKSVSPWPMLSQNMGYHFGDNVELSGDGKYRIKVSITSPNSRLLGELNNRLNTGSEFEFIFDYREEKRNDISFNTFPGKQGKRGAVPPMDMENLPLSQAPTKENLIGDILGTTTSGDARFLISVINGDDIGIDGEKYLIVSPRTPYNKFIIPMMSLSARLSRNGETILETSLTPSLHKDINYHYGGVIDSVNPGDTLTIKVQTPSQVARHEGYETAFIDMPNMKISI